MTCAFGLGEPSGPGQTGPGPNPNPTKPKIKYRIRTSNTKTPNNEPELTTALVGISQAEPFRSHPVLRRDALRLFTQIKASIGCKTRIGTSTTAQLRPQSLSGKSLITNPEDEVRTHFETLAATWNQHYEKSKRTDAIQPL